MDNRECTACIYTIPIATHQPKCSHLETIVKLLMGVSEVVAEWTMEKDLSVNCATARSVMSKAA